MSDDTINEIKSIKTLDDIKKFISNKKANNEKLSFEEYMTFYSLVFKNGSIEQMDFETSYMFVVEILPDTDDFFDMVLKNSWPFNLIKGSGSYQGTKEIIAFIEKKIKEDNENGLKFYLFVKISGYPWNNLIDIIDFGKKNSFADRLFYVTSFSDLDVNKINKIFENYNGKLRQKSFYNLIRSCEDEAISKEVIKKLFEANLDFDILVRQKEYGSDKEHNISFYELCRKCEKGAIDKQTMEKIFNKIKIDKFLLTESDVEDMLPAFDSEAQNIFKDKIKNFTFKVDLKQKEKTFSRFYEVTKKQFEKIIVDQKTLLSCVKMAPDFDIEDHGPLNNDWINGDDNDKKYLSYFKKEQDPRDIWRGIMESGKKLELEHLKMMVLFGDFEPATFTKEEFKEKNKNIISALPDVISPETLYFACQLYQTVKDTDKAQHWSMDKEIVDFYIDHLDNKSKINQYILGSFLAAVDPDVIDASHAQKLLKNFVQIRIKDQKDHVVKIDDADYKDMLAKFDEDGKKVFKQVFENQKNLKPEDWDYDASKYNNKDEKNETENGDESKPGEKINTDPKENQDSLVLDEVINKIKTADKIDDKKLNFIESRLASLEKSNNDIRTKFEFLENVIKEALENINKKLENNDLNLNLNNTVEQVKKILKVYPRLSKKDKDNCFKELECAKSDSVKLKEVFINIISYLFKLMTGKLRKDMTFSVFVKEKRQKGIIYKIKDKILENQPKEYEQNKSQGFKDNEI